MAKQLNVNLAFTADTGKARAELQLLQKQLSDLTKVNSTSNSENGFIQNIQEAVRAAAQLKSQLDAAMDVNTGRLDLSKFNNSLKNSGMSLEKYKNLLVSLGPAGERAFISLASSIQSADVPMRRVSSYLAELKTTLANTARWQVSSSILHGFMGAVSTAYGYAQDLNESLNNIRIVTGYSADEMAKFAEEANKAAKALSTTTTEYTNASLIYYQQGLSAEEVQKRTEVTVKMANVARQSAEVVSDQMTAIWNNFYDGTKSLEYYADVMTALGAKTASSTDEIAGGLEKFAAIGDTIGLSYEYAAAALATITSNTRQSEEVVGTALKTIFARIQGLNLGETLDDGTTLNKYSEALAKVGISIFDQVGELKNMDTILNEMGSKWNDLNSAQQTALAQTVAGVRQYTQLIALMENWNNGDNDSFQANLTTIDSSSGALENQHEIYAEGWEAARDRVKAALEDIYQDLLDDDFFITILDGFEKIFSTVDKAIDMMGGLKGVIAALGTVLLHTFSKELSASLTNFGANIMKVSGQAETAAAKMKRDAALMVGNMVQDSDTQQGYATQTAYQAQSDAQLAIINNAERMNDIEKNTVQLMLDGVKALGDQAIAQGRIADEAQRTVDNQIREFGRTQNRAGVQISEQELTSYTSTLSAFGSMESGIQKISTTLSNSLKNFNADAITSGQILYNSFNSALERFDTNLDMIPEEARTKFSMLSDSIREKMTSLRSEDGKTFEGSKEDLEAMLRDAQQLLEMVRRTGDEYQGNFVTEKTMPNSSQETHLNNMANAARQAGEESERASQQMDGLADSANNVVNAAENSKGKISDLSSQLVSAATAISTATMAFSMLSSLIDTLSNPDATPWERISAILTTLPIIIVQTISAFKALQAAKLKDTTTNLLNAAAEIYLAKTKRDTAQASKESAAATSTEVPAQTADTVSNLTEAASEEALAKAKKKNGKISLKNGKTTAASIDSGAKTGARSIGQSLSTLAPAIASIGIAIAAIAGAIAIYQAVEDWWNKNANDAERAKNSAKAAAEGYNNLKISHDNLTNSFNNYEKEIKGLDSLTKGTLEYQDALLSANEAAFDLINNYEGLTYTINADGLVEIDKESLETVQKEQLKTLQEMQFLKQQAEADAKQAEAIAKRTEFLREDIKTNEAFLSEDTGRAAGNGTAIGLGAGAAIGAGVALSGALAGTKFGAALGSFAGPIGTAIGAAAGAVIGVTVGAVVGAAIEESETERETAAMDKLVAAYEIEGESVFETGRLEELLGEENADLADALRKNEQETRELVRKMAAANELEKIANTQRAQQLYGSTTTGLSEDQKEAIERQQGEALTNLAETIYKDFVGDSRETDATGKLKDDTIQKIFVELSKGLYEKVNNKSGNKAIYVYGKNAGEKAGTEEEIDDILARQKFSSYLAELVLGKKTEVDNPEIAAILDKAGKLDSINEYLATLAADENILKAEDIASSVLAMSNTAYGQEGMAYLSGDVTSSGFKNSQAIIAGLSKFNYGKSNGSGRDEWDAMVADIFGSYEMAQRLADEKGLSLSEFIESYVRSLTNAVSNATEEAGKILLTTTPQEIFNKYKDSFNVNINEIPKVAQKIQDAFIMGGEESADAIGKLYTQLGSEADKFNDAIEDIDWDTTSIQDFRTELSKAGINLSNVDNELLEVIISLGRFTTQLQKTANAIYSELNEIASLKYGDIVSEEEWATVPEELQRFYTAAAGGGYRLTDPTGLNQYYASGQAISAYDNAEYFQFKSNADRNYLEKIAFGDPGDSNIYHNTSDRRLQTILDFLQNVPEISSQLSEDEKDLVTSLQKELNAGTNLRKTGEDHTLLSLFSKYYKNFDYDTYLKNAIEESADRQQDAILNSILATYDLSYEELEKYGTDAEGIAQARFDRGIETLVSEYESRLNDKDVFEGIDVASLSIPAWENLQTAVADVLNVGTDEITRDYVQNLIDSGIFENLVKSDGDWQQAIQTARTEAVTAATNNIIASIKDITDLPQETLNVILSNVFNMSTLTNAEDVEVAANEINASIGGVIEGGLDTIIKFFEALGWETYVDKDGKIHISGLKGTATTFGSDLGWTPTKTSKEKDIKEKEAFDIDDDQFKSLDKEVDRYHEINNELEVLADNLDAISKEKDRAYGANRVKLIDQETAALKQQLSVQERYIDEIEDYLADDRAKMDKYGFMFNEDADIINYDEVMDQQIQAYNAAYQAYIAAKNAAVDAFNAAVQSGTSEEDAEKIYDAAIKAADATWEAAQERYETFEKELQQYEESVDLLRQQEQVLQDIKYQIQDLNYEKIQYKLEVKMEINDAEMRMLDYYLNKLSDDFYSMAEAAQLMVDKVPLMTQALGNYESFYNELESAYAAGDISQEAYVDGLKQSYDGILDNLEALQNLDKEMMHYYEDTLVAGQEELAHYTDSMEHLTSVLDHYHNLIVMINGEYDYDSIGTVLEGKASTIKNELEVASANYEMLLEQQALIQSHYDNAIDENARALHAEELKAINAQVDEAHELMLSKTEEWAEVQKAIMENIMAKAAREMEMAFTNNMGFDALSNSLDRLSSTADVYLTETNKIYETQTLINKAQKDIDKTTNNAAKIRLKNYQEEIELLQNKNKLTKVELDIAKAKYDVLLAEIALEEAQNAKSTVRLQRDNEGNYGYVYTADQSKVADAEQNLLDTQNALYNIRLEAANEYGQKIMELNQQLADDLMALEQARVDGQFATEAEYQAAKDLILQEYYALYEGYSQSYTDATKEDARIEKEAWISAYSDIIDSANNWQYKVNEYTDKCEDAYRDYRNTVSTESDVINRLLGDVEGAVKDVTKESDNLKNKVKNEVIPQIRDQYTKIANVTAAYAAQRTGILQLIQTYEQLAQSILKAMQAQANLNALEETPTGPTVPQTQTNNKPETKPTTEDASAQDKARAKAIALEAQEIVTKVHTGAIPMHSSGLGWQPSAREQGYSEDAIKVALQAFNDSKPGAGWDYYYDIALQLASRYNTGGYTGVWGPDGRMAILDEKELVLNQHDTENFLMATEILRSIVDIIDFNSLHNQISWLSSTGFASAGAGPLEQSVSIEAHFPNVSDRNEIEEAFNNLINTASQYANRKF